ncbi:PPOX class F420-dependent oxidoreductase [Rhodococcus sp. NPDC058521]|uniref:PPOX class F420-dependent oxidoreductase n=1 Tax=Rhodococcus sp. NPDC058521 TaxID=3346536 RepID=UPI00364F1849
MTFSKQELDYLSTQHLGRLATVQPNGTLQVSPVGFTVDSDSGTIDIQGYKMTASRKFKNVADNGGVAFVVDDLPSVDPWRVRCVEIRGRAEAIDATATIRVHPERIISFGLEGTELDVHAMKVDARDVT